MSRLLSTSVIFFFSTADLGVNLGSGFIMAVLVGSWVEAPLLGQPYSYE